MNKEKYICPICGEEMSWTGNVSQNLDEKRWSSLLYEYQCRNGRFEYKTKYKQLDTAGIKVQEKIDMGYYDMEYYM